jgi:hypothetical protein
MRDRIGASRSRLHIVGMGFPDQILMPTILSQPQSRRKIDEQFEEQEYKPPWQVKM